MSVQADSLAHTMQDLGRCELDADSLLKTGFGLQMKRSQVEDLRKLYRYYHFTSKHNLIQKLHKKTPFSDTGK
jgi:hypothetical protein